MDEQVRPDGLVLEIDSDFIQEEDQKKSRSKPLKKQNVTLKSIQSPAISTANKLDHKKEKETFHTAIQMKKIILKVHMIYH